MRKQRNSNGYTHIFGVQQHGETFVDTVRRQRNRKIKDGCHKPEVHMQCSISQLVYKIATLPVIGGHMFDFDVLVISVSRSIRTCSTVLLTYCTPKMWG